MPAYPDVDRFLAAYPLDDSFKKWSSLSDKMTSSSIARLSPPSQQIQSVGEVQGASGIVSQRCQGVRQASTFLEENQDSWKKMQLVDDARIAFTDVPRRLLPKDATPELISKHARDKTTVLEHLLVQLGGGMRLYCLSLCLCMLIC